MLGLRSAKSRPQVQLIRAEPSSNGSSEPLSESLSKLSSHQIPHSPVPEGTTTAKGLYANFFFVLIHYAFGGVGAGCVSSHSALHFDFGVEQACSAAARVLLASPSRTPPSSASSCLAFFLYEAFPHAEGRCPRIHVFCGSALPSSGSTSSSSCVRLCAGTTCTGADGCVFPSATAGVFKYRIAYVIASCLRLFRGAFFYLGGQTCFPGRDCVQLRVHCCIALFC